jgi:hypothetical protein
MYIFCALKLKFQMDKMLCRIETNEHDKLSDIPTSCSTFFMLF